MWFISNHKNMSEIQLHKRLDEQTVVTILERYLSKELSIDEAMKYLCIGRSRFFEMVKAYRNPKVTFSIAYKRTTPKRMSSEAEKHILAELEEEKKLIENRNIPVWTYNYSAVRDTVLQKYQVDVSVPTIITRAKDHGYYQFNK